MAMLSGERLVGFCAVVAMALLFLPLANPTSETPKPLSELAKPI